MTLLVAACGIAAFPSAAWGYVDPGAGSLLLQGLLGALAAGVAVASAYWRKVRDFIVRRTAARDGE